MKQTILFLFIVAIFSTNAVVAQGKIPDEIHLKYYGTIKGKVISIKENSVEFRSDSTYMYYDYPKKDVDFIVLSSGEWITFSNERRSNEGAGFSWGYLTLSGGGLMNQKPSAEAALRKRGYSVLADLNYQPGESFSTGLQIGYNELDINHNAYLSQNGYSDTNSTVSGGTSYLFSVGSINRIFLFPNSSFKPVISFFVGYGNLLISQTEIISATGSSVVSDLAKHGLLAGGGISFFIETGTRSGFILGSKYNWLFYKKENLQFVNFNIGYAIPIN